MEALCDYGVFPIRLNNNYIFYRNGRTSCPDIISVTNKVNDLHVRSKVLNAFTASDHQYIVHTFKTRTVSDRTKFFKYVTKGLTPDIFLNRFDEITNAENFNTTDDADKVELLQACMVRNAITH